MNNFITKVIQKHTTNHLASKQTCSVSGGCINNAYQVVTNSGVLFLKWNHESLANMFISEEKGLSILNEKSPILTPKTLGSGTMEGKSYLLTEWIAKGHPSSHYWENFGNKLAEQHKVTQNAFGLEHDNFIGSLPQSNNQHQSWADFFINERLAPQVKRAESGKLLSVRVQQQFDLLFNKLSELIPIEKPALLHGDLWSGNFMTHESGEAAIFDPAVHYGHRETELAFTRLFGGFSPEFYQSYHSVFPIESGFEDRVDIHNLYPLLVHVNLFGSSYLSGIIQTLNRFT